MSTFNIAIGLNRLPLENYLYYYRRAVFFLKIPHIHFGCNCQLPIALTCPVLSCPVLFFQPVNCHTQRKEAQRDKAQLNSTMIMITQPSTRCCSKFVWKIAVVLCQISTLSSGFLTTSPVPAYRQQTAIPPVRQPNDCGMALDVRNHNSWCRHRLYTTTPLLMTTKEGMWPLRLLKRKKTSSRISPARTSSYLATMDKRRGYRRKSLGGIAQLVNNTDVVMTPPEVATAIVGMFSSQAFK